MGKQKKAEDKLVRASQAGRRGATAEQSRERGIIALLWVTAFSGSQLGLPWASLLSPCSAPLVRSVFLESRGKTRGPSSSAQCSLFRSVTSGPVMYNKTVPDSVPNRL
ncbi:hypothetical protein BDV19DRAFT_214038 [Aspergillus venezuelensis]